VTDRGAIEAACDSVARMAARWGQRGFHSGVVREAQAMVKVADQVLLQDCSLPGPAIVASVCGQLDRLDAEIRSVEQTDYASSLIGACRRLATVLDNEIRPWLAS
jgi:hypothetical protein